MYLHYVSMKLLIANELRVMFTYNADSTCYLTNLESLRNFTESVVI